MATTYSNPRMHARIEQWPWGRDLRTTATFVIETHPTRGQRAVRTTIDPKTGRVSKPKALTYARQARIVDGDDGRTYIAELGIYSQSISIMRGDMQLQAESITADDPRHAALLAMFTA